MPSKEEIIQYLKEFHYKMSFWGIVFRDDRSKNTQTMLDLEITREQKIKVLNELLFEDYSEGPIAEKLYGGADMWVFGKMVKKKEIYIKITIGMVNNQTICISFHIAEFDMNYPFKDKS
ncbi:MAG: hypothetical protein ACOVO1_01390 [Chitinophagaceae bacterium]